MDSPVIIHNTVIRELLRGENNPRNSEGDFARLSNGDILFAYSRYTGASAHDDAACNIAGLISHDNGNTFEPLPQPLALAAYHGVQNIMSVSLKRIPNGDLCLFYLCKEGARSSYWLSRASKEDETRFLPPELCVPAAEGIYYVVNNCRVHGTNDHELLVPFALHAIKKEENGEEHGVYFGDCRIFAADGNGKNWSARSPIIKMPYPEGSGTGLQEPGLITLPDGRLYAYFRTDRCFQFQSFSSDAGKSWSVPVPSRFTSPDSPLLIAQNPYSGIYYAVWNPIPNYNGRLDQEKRWISAGRTPFVLAQSRDGLSFSSYTVLENDPTHGYCYPAVFFLDKTQMLLSYCAGGPEDGMCLTKTKIVKITLKPE